jgi:hypothetical protein
VKAAFQQARSLADDQEIPLRIRLTIGPSAADLHGLWWETLVDPQTEFPLFTGENLLFSRYWGSSDVRPVRTRARGDLKALVMVANPTNLATYQLQPIEVQEEIAQAKGFLKCIDVSTLPADNDDQRATFDDLLKSLSADEFDILYLICHGSIIDKEPWLWLESQTGEVERVSGFEFVNEINKLPDRPRLVLLVSCESAGADTGKSMVALGPLLAQSGIPAVLAMQGKISIETVQKFIPVFFEELNKDGHIDRAVSVARRAIRNEPDWWMPTLFMRLKTGRIWYETGFGLDGHEDFEKWDSLAKAVSKKRCTPILGPGLPEILLGSRRDLAIRWAEKHGFPLSPHAKDNLPSVAQYVITRHQQVYVADAYMEAIQDGLLRRFKDLLPGEFHNGESWDLSQVDQALQLAASHQGAKDPDYPYYRLAAMRLPIYITTETQDLLRHALTKAGAEPVVRICKWNKFIPTYKATYEEEPSDEKPLIYHIFGHASEPDSLVYSEDQFFEYLIGVTQYKKLLPNALIAALCDTSLLFLGFQMDDWEFRVLFRVLMAQEGRELLKRHTHAAAQIEPDEDRITDINRTRRYLEDYFNQENISIYWGNSREFLREFQAHMG